MIGPVAAFGRKAKLPNAEKLQRMYELINMGDVDGFVDYLSEDFVDHEPGPGIELTKAGAKDFFKTLLAAFPDVRFDTEDIVESGDKLAARARVTGTNKGDFFGIPASGKRVDVEAIDILRFGDDGLVHEHWGVMDMMSMMQQLGVVPPPPPA